MSGSRVLNMGEEGGVEGSDGTPVCRGEVVGDVREERGDDEVEEVAIDGWLGWRKQLLPR